MSGPGSRQDDADESAWQRAYDESIRAEHDHPSYDHPSYDDAEDHSSALFQGFLWDLRWVAIASVLAAAPTAWLGSLVGLQYSTVLNVAAGLIFVAGSIALGCHTMWPRQ